MRVYLVLSSAIILGYGNETMLQSATQRECVKGRGWNGTEFESKQRLFGNGRHPSVSFEVSSNNI